jgi:hypothetical protein
MGVQAFSKAYLDTAVGAETWVDCSPDETLDDFRVVIAAAEALQAVNHISILELRQELWRGRPHISALRFRRRR